MPDARSPAPREKIFNIPNVILCLIALMAAAHWYRTTLGDEAELAFFSAYAFVPGRLAAWFDPGLMQALLAKVGQGDGEALRQAQAARYFLADGPAPWTLLTHAFLHGDWTHFGLNALWLLAFGAAVARRFGTLRFLAFCAIAAMAGAGAHYLTHMHDFAPMIGASGAVSGAMAGAARFAFQPGGPLGEPVRGIDRQSDAAYRQPALSLAGVLHDRRTLTFLGVWFTVNFLFGIASEPLGVTDSPIAWEAHVGGFLAGFLLFDLFERRM